MTIGNGEDEEDSYMDIVNETPIYEQVKDVAEKRGGVCISHRKCGVFRNMI